MCGAAWIALGSPCGTGSCVPEEDGRHLALPPVLASVALRRSMPAATIAWPSAPGAVRRALARDAAPGPPDGDLRSGRTEALDDVICSRLKERPDTIGRRSCARLWPSAGSPWAAARTSAFSAGEPADRQKSEGHSRTHHAERPRTALSRPWSDSKAERAGLPECAEEAAVLVRGPARSRSAGVHRSHLVHDQHGPHP